MSLVSKSGRRLSRQHSTTSDGMSEGSIRKEENAPPPNATMWRLLKVNRPEWGYGLVGALGSICSGLMNPGFALVISSVLYAYYDTDYKKMQKDVSKYALIFVGLGGAAIFGYFAQHFFFGIMGENLVKRVRELMFARKLHRLVSLNSCGIIFNRFVFI